jgi:hypothetical protein
MVKYGVLFEVRTEYFNIHTSFGFKGLMEKEAKNLKTATSMQFVNLADDLKMDV